MQANTEREKRNLGLWRAEGCPVHILGSLHLLGEFAYPLPAEIERAYSEAKTMVVEADPEPPSLPSIRLYDDGRTLATVLPPELNRMTDQVLAACSVDPKNVQNLKPWFLALFLSTCFYRTHGCVPERGLDIYFTRRAKAEGKRIIELEGTKWQHELFDKLPLDKQFMFLRQVVQDPQRTLLDAKRMIDGWLAWDEEQLASVLEDAEKRFPGLSAFLLTDRNKEWISKIEECMAQGQPTLIAVGALHLIGQDNVISLLRARGHRLIQLLTNC